MQRLCTFLMLGVLATATAAFPRDYREEAKEPVRHTFPAGATTLDVDNINGSVTVIGDNGNTMRVEGEKVIRYNDRQELDRAKREVTLDINQKDGIAQLYVNGPFRNGGNRGSDNHGFHDRDRREYDVTYNLTVRVPRNSALHLNSVNGGVKVEETLGKFDVRTVNGPVTLTNIGGAGTVETVNGRMTASFRENPKADTSFKTVNGEIEATFQPNLAANIQVKTFNGAAYTDFETTALASPAGEVSKSEGRFAFRSRGAQRMKVGAGGPELRFETLNGKIQIRKQGR
jgi:hypothetical protein